MSTKYCVMFMYPKLPTIHVLHDNDGIPVIKEAHEYNELEALADSYVDENIIEKYKIVSIDW